MTIVPSKSIMNRLHPAIDELVGDTGKAILMEVERAYMKLFDQKNYRELIMLKEYVKLDEIEAHLSGEGT